MVITNVDQAAPVVNVFVDKDFFNAGAAVSAMVQRRFVMRDFNQDGEDDYDLIWWCEKTSCFHWSQMGICRGIYTKGTFYNLRPWFIYRDSADGKLLYDEKDTPQAQRLAKLNARRDKELEWLQQQDVSQEVYNIGGFVRIGNHIDLKSSVYSPAANSCTCGEHGCSIDNKEHAQKTTKVTAAYGSRKDDKGKLRYDLLPYDILDQIAGVFTLGAGKYGDNNWQGVEKKRYQAALMRHFSLYMQGEKADAEGNDHLSAIMVNAMFLSWKEKNG